MREKLLWWIEFVIPEMKGYSKSALMLSGLTISTRNTLKQSNV